MAAMVSGAVTHPIDLVKVRMQLDPSAGKSGMFKTGYSVIRNEGVIAIYKGLTASLLRQASFIGTKFGSYDVFKKILQDESGKISFGAKAACGFGAGAAGAIVGNPADLAMVRMQADGKLPVDMRRNYKNAFEAIYRIVSEEGVMTLWRGSSPTVSRAMIITASQLAVYDQIKEELLKFGMEDGPILHVSASILAACVASITSNPVDIVKTRLMNMSPDANGKMPYAGVVDCGAKIVSNEGFFALWKGLGPTMARQAPLNMIRFVFVEYFKKLLGA